MTRVQAVEHEIKKMNKASLAAFRKWFLKYDASLWDDQIERDARGGKLTKLTQEALNEHRSGKTKSL